MNSRFTLIFVLLVVGVFYLWRYRRAPEINPFDLQVETEANTVVPLNTLLSDSSIVICYASWCGPCLKELRMLKEHYALYAGSGVRFYCITDDTADKIEVMRSNMPEAITFLKVNSLKELGVYTIPASFFILENKVVDKQLDILDLQQQEKILESFNP
jgi:thiol-disulfide isomerase/thioredoxin